MSNFENEFINRFKDQESLEGVDSAGIWAAVDAAIVEAPAKGAAFYFTRGGLILLAVLLLFGGSCIYLEKASSKANGYSQKDKGINLSLAYTSAHAQDQNHRSELATSAQLDRTSSQESIAKAKQTSTHSSLNEELLNSVSTNNSKLKETSTSTSLSQNESDLKDGRGGLLNKNTSGTKVANDLGIKNSPVSDDTSLGNQNSNNLTTFKASTIGSKHKLGANEDGGATAQTRSQSIQFMRLIKFQGIDNEQTREAIACGGVVNYEQSLPIEAHLLFGINSTNPLFDGENAERLRNTHSADMGFNTQLGITYVKNHKLRFGIGLGYQEWNTKFEENSSSASTFDLDNRIIGFTQDSLGNYSAVLGTLTYDGISKRRVLHHNKVSMISIPLEIGYQIPLRRMTLGFNTGMSYNLVLSQSGRSLDTAGDYAFYESGASSRPFSKHLISFHANAFLDYSIREKLRLRLSPQIAYIGAQNGSFYAGKTRLLNYGFNAGLVWDF